MYNSGRTLQSSVLYNKRFVEVHFVCKVRCISGKYVTDCAFSSALVRFRRFHVVDVTMLAFEFVAAEVLWDEVEHCQDIRAFFKSIANQEYANGPEDEKAEFIRLLFRQLIPTHINVPLIDQMKDLAKINVKTKPQENVD